MNLDLNKIKNDIVNSILDDIVSYAASDQEKKLLKEELQAKIEKDILITDAEFDQYEVSSSSINQTMNELYVDLLTTFGVLNDISKILSRYNVSYTTYMDYIKSRINQVNDKIESCRNSLSSMHMPAFHIERFRTADQFDKTRSLQKDRHGQWIPSRCYARFADKEQHITLPLIRQDNSLRYDDKVATAYLSTNFQLGEGFIDLKNDTHNIENAIDESMTSMWSDTILSDAPLRVSFDDEKPAELFVNDNYYYGIDNGAVCELEINFESVNTINEIKLSPCVKYPIRIVAIRYKLTDDEDEALVELVTPDNSDKTLREVWTKDEVSYKFPDILCKKIYILFTQEHYLRKTYIYNPSEVYKNELWFNTKNDKRDKVKNAVFKPLYYDRKNAGTTWENINERVISSTDNDISKIIVGSESESRKVIKYEYEYGFYNIGCYNNHFDRTGLYVTKPIKVSSNIKNVEFKVDEQHQKDSLGNHVTDIEYYLTHSPSPDTDDWTPVLPVGKKLIESELLFISDGTRAFFRFEAEKVHCIMKNGEPIPTDSNEYKLDTNERTGKIYCVQIFNYDYDAVYSVKYEPVFGHNSVDFSDKISTSIETFYGNNKNSFKLSNEPFIDLTNDYCSIKLTDIAIGGSGTEIEVRNVTDATNPSAGYKNFDNTTNEFQFYVYKNYVYFNKEIPDNYIIDISYRHLISSIRLKAIFRRNTTKDGWLTPILKEIKYNIETL